jgi:hypothetical protein
MTPSVNCKHSLDTLSQNPPDNAANIEELVDLAIATALHATHSTIHQQTLGISPGGMVFHQDMSAIYLC